jgi:hypothetical protein
VPPVLALGIDLARRGVVTKIALAISVFTALVMIVIAITVALHGPASPVHDVPLVASSALAWGGGFLHAFGAAAQAFVKDRREGVRHLLVVRTTSTRGYLFARVGGLAALLALVVAGGTVLVGIAGMLAASRGGPALKTLHATLAAVAYAIAFATVVAPIALAALGARTRIGGYFFLLGVIVVPDMIAGVLSGLLPTSVTELFGIPSALSALRAALSPGTTDLFRFLRALAAVAVFAAIAIMFVRRDVQRLEYAEPTP